MFKKSKHKNAPKGGFKLAFSLVELMISLIIISLIAAAFVPVITKKLSSSSIFAGSTGGGFNKSCSEIDEDCDLCAGSICLSCKKTCSAGETLNTTSCSCEPKVPYSMAVDGLYVTRFNMGDSSKTKIPAEAGVTVLNYTSTCGSSDDYSTKCCWTGATSGTSCSNANGDYSGCNRTVCNWAAANAICANYKQDGRTWRLATTDEMKNWTNYSIGKGNDGLMLCDGGDGYSSAFCGTGTCKGARYEDCHPDSVWTNSNVSGPNSSYRKYLGLGNWQSIEDYRTRAFSVRCVSDIVSNCETFDSDGETCTACASGYYLSGKECKKSTKVENCETYSKTENKCETCKDGYELKSGKCEVEEYAKLVYGLYVTKFNIGDQIYAQIPSAASISIVNAGESCTDDKCCWRGDTSETNCDATNGTYSGCNRTVCTWSAARAICANYKQDGRTWRLPSAGEIGNWANYSKGRANDGLMLCDSFTGNSSSYCHDSVKCVGALNNSCSPDKVWAQRKLLRLATSLMFSYYYGYLQSGSWINSSYDDACINSLLAPFNVCTGVIKTNTKIGYSVRCVSDTVANCSTYSESNACTQCNTNYYLKNGKCNAVTRVDNCATYSPTEDKCTACEEAYNLSGNKCVFACQGSDFLKIGSLCVTKYNMGNASNTSIPSEAGVTEVGVGETCGSSSDYSTKCCWSGETSGTNCDSANGDYSGCYRKVCNWAAANAICANYTKGGKTWRLPTTSEMSSWSTYYSHGKGNDGLMLCDRNKGYSSAYCGVGSNSCPGAGGGSCYPNHVWSGNFSSSTYAYLLHLQQARWDKASNDRTHAFSVRCVTSM